MDIDDLYKRNTNFLNYLRKKLISNFISGNFFDKSIDYKDMFSEIEYSYKCRMSTEEAPVFEPRQIPTIDIPPTIIRGFYQIADIFSSIRDYASYSAEIYPAIEAYRKNDFWPMVKLLFIATLNQKMDKISIKMGLQLLFYMLFGCKLCDNLYESMEALTSLRGYERKIKRAKERCDKYMVLFDKTTIDVGASLPSEGMGDFIEFISSENWEKWIPE